MKLELPLDQMTFEEKIEAMEAISLDLFRNHPDEFSPDWHREILEERDRGLADGTAKVVDWEDAKARLRSLMNEGNSSRRR